jgi:aldose 1-epimerase
MMPRTLVRLAWAVTVVATAALSGTASAAPEKEDRKVSMSKFGTTADGEAVALYTLTNGKATAKVMTYGAILTELHVPDRDGKTADVVLGFDNLKGYLDVHPYFGATVGRVANRIAKGEFTLYGKTYTLAKNNGPNTLHGGLKGFDKKVWKAEPGEDGEGNPSVKFSCVSPDGEEGFPGLMNVGVRYTLRADEEGKTYELLLQYFATTDRATPVNLTNHSYFNLAGNGAGTILDHEMQIFATHYTPSDATLIPTGELAPVAGTPLDFIKPTPLGARFDQLKDKPIGYDHNFDVRLAGAIAGGSNGPHPIARVLEPKSGRIMDVSTTEPGVQLYTGNFLDGTLTGKEGAVYLQHTGFCLETQHFPDSVNQPKFPSVILEPGETYKQTTIYRFSAK